MVIKKKSKLIRLTNFVKILGLNSCNEIFIKDGKLGVGIGINLNEQFNQYKDSLTIDLENCIVSPGFIDPQVNGFNNCNFWEINNKSYSEIDKLRLDLVSCGVVAFCPTIITAPVERIIESINCINSYIKQSSQDIGARILGIHIEGVFITKFGVHDSKYANPELTVKNLAPFIKDNVILFTLAPELDKTGQAIKYLQSNNILVSIGHTSASYSQGLRAINDSGLRTATHMFNAMSGVKGFFHRGEDSSNIEILKLKLQDEKKINPNEDGIMLALLKDKEVLCMVISDGVHVSKEAVGLLKNFKDGGHFALASDLVSNDFYNFEKLKNNLGGGQTTLDKCVLNLFKWKVSNLEDSLMFASKPISNQLKAAREIGLGEISIDKEANIVLWDTKKNCVKGTIIGENVFLNY